MEENLEPPQPETVERKHPKPWIAFMFSLICTGLGQLYNGQFRKGILFFLLPPLLCVLYGWSRLATSFYGLVIFLAPLFLFQLYVIVDAVKTARRTDGRYIQKRQLIFSVISASIMIGISWNFPPTSILGIRTFNISTEAGEPTVFASDMVIADMKVYETKSPDYGDIVAYKTDDGSIWTFRVVGLPDDTIQLVNNVVSINSKRTQSKLISDRYPFQILEEQSPNGSKHIIQRLAEPLDNTKNTIKIL